MPADPRTGVPEAMPKSPDPTSLIEQLPALADGRYVVRTDPARGLGQEYIALAWTHAGQEVCAAGSAAGLARPSKRGWPSRTPPLRREGSRDASP